MFWPAIFKLLYDENMLPNCVCEGWYSPLREIKKTYMTCEHRFEEKPHKNYFGESNNCGYGLCERDCY